jgi:putative transcriptional regulator
MHRYVESGLDNIYLENGYRIHRTPYGEGISIQDTEGLNRAIGRWLASLPKPLTGAELRFLRLEMEATQKDLAGILGTTEQTLRLWEKNRKKPMPGPADRLLRALYLEFTGKDESVRKMLERLAKFNETDSKIKVRFRETRRGWTHHSVPSSRPHHS